MLADENRAEWAQKLVVPALVEVWAYFLKPQKLYGLKTVLRVVQNVLLDPRLELELGNFLIPSPVGTAQNRGSTAGLLGYVP
jgi:hypothetical protein